MKQFNFLSKSRVLRLLSVLVLIFTFGIGQMWGAVNDLVYTLSFSQLTSGTNVSTYTATHTITGANSKTWTVQGNQSAGAWLQVGGKSSEATDVIAIYNSTANITSVNVGKVVVTHSGIGGNSLGSGKGNATPTIYSVKLEVASDNDFSTITDTKTINNPSTNSDIEFTPTSSVWDKASYYRITYNYKTNNSSKNSFVKVSAVKFYEGASTPSCTAPTSPTITGTTSYTAGQTISLTASATGTTNGTTTYQWYKGDPDNGGTSQGAASTSGATFTKTNCVVGDAGTYYCVISNGTGCTAKTSKTITVSAPSYTVGWSITSGGGTLSATSGTSTTVTPTSGWRYADPAYTVLTGASGVSQSTNTFTANPTANSTIQINMEQIPTRKINFHINGGTCATSSVDVLEGATYTTMPTVTGLTENCEYGTFVGWTQATSIASASACPDLVTSVTMSTSNVDLYAVYSKTTGGGGSTPASITLLPSDFGSSYPSGANGSGTITKGDYSFTYGQFTQNQNGTPQYWCKQQLIQARCTLTVGLWNTTEMDITSVVVYKASPTGNSSTWAVYESSSSEKPTTGAITASVGSASELAVDKYYSSSCHTGELTDVTETPQTYTASSGCKYIYFAPTNGTSYFTKIVINHTISGGGTTTYSLDANCCTELGQINGSFFWTTHFYPVWPEKHRLKGYYTNLGITSVLYRIPHHLIYTMYISRDFE